MNAELLLAHYVRIADAPDAIARLRRFILDLAVRGKLVAQDPNDEPTLELLKRIPVALPPLSEQHRIVAKVDELMALCDQLEASLAQGEQTRSKLLEAVLHEALEAA